VKTIGLSLDLDCIWKQVEAHKIVNFKVLWDMMREDIVAQDMVQARYPNQSSSFQCHLSQLGLRTMTINRILSAEFEKFTQTFLASTLVIDYAKLRMEYVYPLEYNNIN